jgi:hypothetical protein
MDNVQNSFPTFPNLNWISWGLPLEVLIEVPLVCKFKYDIMCFSVVKTAENFDNIGSMGSVLQFLEAFDLGLVGRLSIFPENLEGINIAC